MCFPSSLFSIPNIRIFNSHMSLKKNSSLPFLDVNVMRSNGSFTTSVHHKRTSTGLFTNFDSCIPMMYKKCLLFSLISRYFNICSSYISFQCEMANFKKTFSSNGYPKALIDIVASKHFLRGFKKHQKQGPCMFQENFLLLPSFHWASWSTYPYTT